MSCRWACVRVSKTPEVKLSPSGAGYITSVFNYVCIKQLCYLLQLLLDTHQITLITLLLAENYQKASLDTRAYPNIQLNDTAHNHHGTGIT